MRKLKILSIPVIIYLLIATILSPVSYESNTVEKDKSSVVSCETIMVNEYRGLNEEDILLSLTEFLTPTPTPTVMPTPEIKSLSIEEDEEKDIPNRWNILLTYDEIELLAKIVWLESSGEDDKGQQGVVEVVFNRMVHWDLEGSLYDVLSHKNAFSTWKNRNKAKPTEKEYTNIYKVLAGETDILDFDTVYFSTEARNDDIAAHIGHHYFCRYEYSCPEDKE